MSRLWNPAAALFLLVLALAAGPGSAVRADDAPARPQFDLYQNLLSRYVFTISKPGAPLDTRFDYEKLYVDERLITKAPSDRFQAIRDQLLEVPPSSMSGKDRLAWAINTYNYLVIENATKNLLVPMRGFLRYKSVDEMYFTDGGFFDHHVIDVEGRPYSLKAFERRFLYDDTTDTARPAHPLADPRVRFALVPPKIGAPPLAWRAYRGDSLDRQLERAVRTTLALPRHSRVAEGGRYIEAGALFNTYADDFGGSEAAFAFLAKQGPPAVRAAIAKQKLTSVGRFIPYDAALNQIERRKPPPAKPTDTPKTPIDS